MDDIFRILLVLDFALEKPWHKGTPSAGRPKVRAIPEIAILRRGTPVQWIIRHYYPYRILALRWEIYFEHGSPFHNVNREMRLVTEEGRTIADDQYHSGSFEPVIAEEEGEFKYGIRVLDLNAKEEGEFKYGIPVIDVDNRSTLLSDEDPLLTVQ